MKGWAFPKRCTESRLQWRRWSWSKYWNFAATSTIKITIATCVSYIRLERFVSVFIARSLSTRTSSNLVDLPLIIQQHCLLAANPVRKGAIGVKRRYTSSATSPWKFLVTRVSNLGYTYPTPSVRIYDVVDGTDKADLKEMNEPKLYQRHRDRVNSIEKSIYREKYERKITVPNLNPFNILLLHYKSNTTQETWFYYYEWVKCAYIL